MKLFKSSLLIISSLGFIFLGACSNGTQTTNSPTSTASSPTETPAQNPSTTSTEATVNTGSNSSNTGRQVVESGPYHLEFEAVPENNGTHIDFYLQTGDDHQAISDANVTAQVQLPDGSQKELPLSYDAEGKHYAALLPGQTSGEHQVVVLSEIKGEKVNGRFTFNR
ncbi:hypothetical protein [Gloeocapsopsis sp. IPPAS B-1203]|uniref:hypothetical protein n=1 Tax=Gloeocapsopsis sp. IPPAS B-1203 TaxID=2049454 RepID=UPI000C197610|nr:hypothetical protein [Gloeocapsopsis sp. IPPAS B-1203]PIG91640.1 hypothetical protein CSQ79_20635 [Gloeocapsopsis sp. IPPAS B-1203]